MKPPFTILEHPADLGIEATGATLAEAFENAAAALMSIILDTSTVQLRETREITLFASDREQLLVKWLSEVLYLYDGQRFVGKEFKVLPIAETRLQASVRGEAFATEKHSTRLDVKAVTYHQLKIEEDAHGARVVVYLDI
jgi:SHS2 domain-containing protein